MIDTQIRDAILFAVGERWTKVAKVILRVADAIGRDLPSGDEGYNAIAGEIAALVRAGRLISRGNIENWRFSELRRPDRQEDSN
ncbi:MAG: hypothetical protein M3P45_01630 [Acidobacteriota bacterium]|nr:hypothetical protein [Acidobacteriota bacterium]